MCKKHAHLKMNLLDLLSAVVAHFESMYGPHVAFKGHFVVGFEAATLLRTLQVLRPVLVLHVVSETYHYETENFF